jgi:hypothetical protein
LKNTFNNGGKYLQEEESIVKFDISDEIFHSCPKDANGLIRYDQFE